jgi:poly(hydroxyalkanoate) depolymerase family esterase
MKGNEVLPLLRVFPENVDFVSLLKKVDPKKPLEPFFIGLFEQKIAVGEEKRAIKVFLPKTAKQGSNSVHIAIPSGVETKEFLQKSGWMAIAEQNELVLFVYEPNYQQWLKDNIETEINYIKTAFDIINERIYYNIMLGNFYFAGYGDGGLALQQYIMSNPKVCAAMAIFDGSENIDMNYMKRVGTTLSDDPKLLNSKVPAPVWILSERITKNTQNVVDYWLRANDCEHTSKPFEDGRQYRASKESSVGIVQITEHKVDYYDQDFTKKVWNQFLKNFSRFGSAIYNNRLCETLDFTGLGIEPMTMEVDGFTREWFEYVPVKGRNSEEKLPLVVALHGFGQTGKIFVGYSQWHEVARERGFVVVFPTGSIVSAGSKSIPKSGWNLNGSLSNTDDYKFIAELIKNVKSRNHIDETRVYISGQSMGSMMTNYLAMTMPEIFAAAGSMSAPILNVDKQTFEAYGMDNHRFEFLKKVNTDYQIPVRLFIGEHDLWGDGSHEGSPTVKATIDYWIDWNDAGHVDEPFSIQPGEYENKIYVNKQNVPMVQYTMTKNRGHNCIPQEMWLVWDEWFSKYTREADGSIRFHARFKLNP